MQHSEIPYWMSLAHLPRWPAEKVNRLSVNILQGKSMTLEGFFKLSEKEWSSAFSLAEKEIDGLRRAKKELPNNAFLAEDLLSQGFDIIPLSNPRYPAALKENLKLKHAPPLLYIKGNTELLQEHAVAVVGSRDAAEISLRFTDAVAKKASKKGQVVVSGFAKGVDRQALDSALQRGGKSIIVLPQGIMTFSSGINTYYKHIVRGDVLVLSTFHPKAPWSVGLAMARNPIIYGLAREIYVAQSSNKGGTWEGVRDGLAKGRTLYVRIPEDGEKNANKLLIEKGAVGVDGTGTPVYPKGPLPGKEHAAEEISDYAAGSIDEQFVSALKGKSLTAKQVKEITGTGWSAQKISKYLKGLASVAVVEKSKPLKFRIKAGQRQQRLFG